MLYFVSTFKRTFISEQHGMPSPDRADGSMTAYTAKQKRFRNFIKRIGLTTLDNIISTVFEKLANNLRYFGNADRVVHETLAVMWEMVFSYSSARLLLRLDAVKFLLTNHTEEMLPFLTVPANSRYRSTFYVTVARLLFMEDNDDMLDEFMGPIIARMDVALEAAGERSREAMAVLIGMFRDLRGIFAASQTKESYTRLFEILYPRYMPVFHQTAEVWADTPQVIVPMLKFLLEIVYNKTQRITFENTSAHGILLFKEAATIITTLAENVIPLPIPAGEDPYASKLKMMGLMAGVMSNSLDGGYVPFGVFRLYEDPTLDNVMSAALRVVLSIPREEMSKYPKMARFIFKFIHIVFRSHMEAAVALEPGDFQGLLATLETGLDSLDNAVSSHAAHAIDSLASFFVRNFRREKPEMEALRAQVEEVPTVFSTFLGSCFNIVAFGHVANQWSLSRPILPCILANLLMDPGSFDAFAESVVSQQAEEAQEPMSKDFEQLMDDVSTTLESTNRDKFQQKLVEFRSSVLKYVKT
jgi:exportin-7